MTGLRIHLINRQPARCGATRSADFRRASQDVAQTFLSAESQAFLPAKRIHFRTCSNLPDVPPAGMRSGKYHAAFTMPEMLVVIAVIAFVALLLLPAFFTPHAHAYPKTSEARCADNLKQIALAFRIWEGDNGDRYPMSLYTNAAGEQLFTNAALACRYFQIMSNELNNPGILICPEDKKHKGATNFTSDFNGSHISYFVGLEADERFPQRFLAGDTHLTNGTALKNGILELTPKHPGSWTAERHGGKGNIAMADGSVQQFDTRRLQKYIQGSNITERLLMPDSGTTK